MYHVARAENHSHLSGSDHRNTEVQKLPSSLPRIARLSKAWQAAIKLIAFRSLTIKSTEIDYLQTIVTGRRRQQLAHVKLEVLLPEYTDEAAARVKSEEEQRINNQECSPAIAELFAVLKAWEDNGVQKPLHFELGGTYLLTDLRRYEVTARQDNLSRIKRFYGSYVRLLDFDELPAPSNIEGFMFTRERTTRNLAQSVVSHIVASLPSLKRIDWVSDKRTVYQNTSARIHNRTALVDALANCHVRLRSTAYIDFWHRLPRDQLSTRRSLVTSGLTYDPFSAAIRTFS
jgi:hypothetical protein